MSRIDPKKKKLPATPSLAPIPATPAMPPIPIKPTEEDAAGARSGSGAGTAMAAMLKKRLMRAGRDEPSPEPIKKIANE